MKVIFRTNIDCCKPLMDGISGMWEEAPNVGDHVVVYENATKVVELQVVSPRVWRQTKTRVRYLEIELHLTQIWSMRGLKEFEKFVVTG